MFFIFRANCLKAHDLVEACWRIEQYLNNSPNSRFRGWRVRFKLAGSTAEGTKAVPLDELDITIDFGAIDENTFELPTKPTELVFAKGKSLPGMEKFDFFQFNQHLLEDLAKCMEEKSEEFSNLNITFRIHNSRFELCPDCRDLKEDGKPYTHCTDCHPAVTSTRMGPCIVMFYKERELVTIDLIPSFQVPQYELLPTHNLVARYLIDEMPLNWLNFLRKLRKSSQILPEAMSAQKEQEQSRPKRRIKEKEPKATLAVKVLHYGSCSPNFLLRPGQVLQLDQLEDPQLKRVYCTVKIIKAYIGAEMTSYLLKKTMLLPDFVLQAKNARDEFEVLYLTMTHPHLKKYFESKVFEVKHYGKRVIDFELWEKKIEEAKKENRKCDQIPTKSLQ